MTCRKSRSRLRRGLAAVECVAVCPFVVLLAMGAILAGAGIVRYRQLSYRTAEGPPSASVDGPALAAATGNARTSTSGVLPHVDRMGVGLGVLSRGSMSDSATSLPRGLSFTHGYAWKPGGFFSHMTWTPTSTMAATY